MTTPALVHDNLRFAAEVARTQLASEQLRTVKSEELFCGDRLVLIEHAGQQYRLLITRNDRLILQK